MFSLCKLESDLILCSESAATRLQAKYKGYKQKGEFKKQKEAGTCCSIKCRRDTLCWFVVWEKDDYTPSVFILTSSATKIETCWRGVQARKEREKRAWAVKVIKKWDGSQMSSHSSSSCVTFTLIWYFMINYRFIKGYMNRGQAKSSDNSEYLAFVRQNYLNRLKNHLPKTVLDKTSWLPPPAVLTEVQPSTQLHCKTV